MSQKDYPSNPSYVPELPKFSLRTLLIAFLVASIFFAVFAFLRDQHLKHQAELEQRNRTMLATLDETAKEVESIRATLGRAPADEKELEQLMGHPMPEVLGRGVRYRRTAANSYELAYLVEWLEGYSGGGDWLVFDSSKPAAGWVPFYD